MAKAPPIVTKNMIRLALIAAQGSVMATAKALGLDRLKLKQRIDSEGLTELVASLKAGDAQQQDAQPAEQQPLPTVAEIEAARKAALAACTPKRLPPDPRIAHGGFILGAKVQTLRWAVAALLTLSLSACSPPRPVRIDYPIDFLCDAHARRCLA